MANPFGMAEFSIPQLIGLDMQIKDRRMQALATQRQQSREDYMFERQQKNDAKSDATDQAYKDVFSGGGGVAAAAGASRAPPLAQTYSNGPTSILPGSTDAPAPAAAPPVASAVSGAQTTTSPLAFKPDPERLRALAATGPAGYQAAAAILKMNGEQAKAAQEQALKTLEMEGQIINGVRKYAPEQRDAEYQRHKQALAAQGIDTSSFPPVWSEEAANAAVTMSMKTAEALGLDEQARAHAEAHRHNVAGEQHDAVMEGQGAAHVEIARHADARAANAPAGVYPVQSKADYDSLPHGTHYSAPDGTVRIKP